MNSPKYEIVSIKTYTSPDGGFSFKYPEFKGWEVSGFTKDGYNISLQNPVAIRDHGEFLVTIENPMITVSLADTAQPPGAEGVKIYNKETGEIIVPTPQGSHIIVKIPPHEEYGFSAQAMADMVFKSFTFDTGISS